MIQPGSKLGHYEVASAIGKGGMGEVWRARDTKLGREVAIKTLPEEFAKDDERLARFEREAKLLASLNHPNIAAIYGLEEDKGTRFLVLELVEGDTLADRLKHGAIPVEASLKLALQIAEALEAAHEKGVIHRDLKPLNIKVTPEGKVKVLDFGLAKAFMADGSDVNLSQSPTLSMAATQKGVILGTAAYMAPEQARGQEVDRRADVWAFGCVLYEMLTGRQTWAGPTVTDMIAAAVAKDADFSILPVNINPRIQELLRRCLEKEPKNRWQAVGDVRVEVGQLLADPDDLFVQPVAGVVQAPPQPMLRGIAVTAVVSVMVAGVAVWILKPDPPEVSRTVTRFDYVLSEDQQIIQNRFAPRLAVTADGSRFVFATDARLYVRSMDDLVARRVTGTESEEAEVPFFSPGGEWIGYFSPPERQLKKIHVSGGVPVPVVEVSSVFSPSWTEDDSILYVQDGTGIMRVSANGGTPEVLVQSEIPLRSPVMLPGGRALLYGISPPIDLDRRVAVRSFESGEEQILSAGYQPNYLPTGHLVYAVGTDIFGRTFDPETLEVGEPVPLVQNVFRAATAAVQWAVSDSGTLVYIPGVDELGSGTPVWVTRDGQPHEPISASPLADSGNPRLSPDNLSLALIVGGDRGDVWVYDVAGRPPMRLTFAETNLNTPLWTPGGQSIVYESAGSLAAVSADVGGGDTEVVFPTGHFHPVGWSAEGAEFVAVAVGRPDTGSDIVRWSINDPEAIQPVVATAADEGRLGVAVSPNGRWLAYASDETGEHEIWVRPYPGPGAAQRVSPSGGVEPEWARDGSELFYIESDLEGNRLMAVEVETGDAFSFSQATTLFESRYSHITTGGALQPPSYDVAPDGRFVMIEPVESNDEAATPRIVVVENWIEELKERVPMP